MTIRSSTFSFNYASYAGGGIYNDSSGGTATVTIINSTVDGNSAAYDSLPFRGGQGGGIDNGGTLTITGSTISGNVARGQHDGQPIGSAGGIAGTVTLTNSTLSGNGASLSGGGLEGGGVIKNCTVSGNGNGGISTSWIDIGNTILNNNSGANINGTATSLGYNISSDGGGGNLTGPGDQINTDPMIGPLQNNGGPTLTHALLPHSPAINAGDPNFTPPPLYDQRGSPFVRVFIGRIDIGAFEVQPLHHITPEPRSRPTPAPRRMP